MNNKELSLYVHIPFCLKRCDYCDFITFDGLDSLIPQYIEALSEEIRDASLFFKEKPCIKSIFFGGGTPTIISSDHIETICKIIREEFMLTNDAEISIEANPGTITKEYLEKIHNAGFNRISLGFQSTNDCELLLLGRIHNNQEALDSFMKAREAGFSNINIDLIYGLPGQNMEKWKTTLSDVVEMDVEHISLYSLTLEKGTKLFKKVGVGELEKIDADLTADMYEYAREELSNYGYDHYEISNWAKKGFECIHNKQYWYANNYLGFGIGAHSHYNNFRYSNTTKINKYIDKLLIKPQKIKPVIEFPLTKATSASKKLSKMEIMQEEMMLGLRLTKEGVSTGTFRKKFGEEMDQVFSKEFDELIASNLAIWDNQRIVLTERGQLVGNQAFMKFVD